MTRILIITNKRDVTCDFIVRELNKRKIKFYRFNTEDLNTVCNVSLDFQQDNFFLYDKILKKEFNLKSFTAVYFRRPGIPDFSTHSLSKDEREFLRNESIYILEGIYKILKDAFWLNEVANIREAENKIYQLKKAKALGFQIPESLITNVYESAVNFYDRMSRNCIVKPIKSGLVGNNGDSKVVFTSELVTRPSSKEQIEISSVYFQRLIKKKFDIRAIVVGEKVFSTLIHSQEITETQIDWRKGEKILKHTKFELPEELNTLSVQLLKEFNLNYGALDFVMDDKDNFVFLEVNPNGQWAWIEQRTGHRISNEIVKLLENGEA